MILQIRNMQSNRCKTIVSSELEKLGFYHNTVELGQVKIKGIVTDKYLKLLDIALKNSGFELMYSKDNQLIKKIKEVISQLISLSSDLPKPNHSEYLSEKVDVNYTHLSNIFSSTQGITIEKYIILQKIERVKELLAYSDLSLNDIAYQMQYSSVSHLSTQFKKITGLTPSFFKKQRAAKL